MEKLTHLMQLIDANSSVLPEGVYLEMCNDMKEVHDNMKGFDDTASYDGVRYAEISNDLHRTVMIIEKIMKRMKGYRFRKRMSKKMKRRAIIDWADQTRLTSLIEYTEEALLECTNLKSVNFVYGWYLDKYNEQMRVKIDLAKEALEDLYTERDRYVEELANEMRLI